MTATGYPTNLEAHVAIRDGSIMRVRPVRADDEPRIYEFLRGLPEEDRLMRFFGLGNNLAATAHQEASVDYHRTMGLVATVDSDERIVAHAMYATSDGDRAEVAFTIARGYQEKGLATLMLGQLAQIAASEGIHTLQAIVLPENRRMLGVLRESGFPTQVQYTTDTVEVSFPSALTPAALARFEHREELAAANALRKMLYPASVAVIGASDKPRSVGAAVMRNLVTAGFPGRIYPVHPTAASIRSLTAYPSVADLPEHVDLAIIAVAAAKVLEVAEQCGKKSVNSLVVLTAGFAEVGPEGQRRQAELLRIARQYGMRIVGPNCIGIINTDPRCPLNATFGPLMPPSGRLGMATQSGALGLAAIDFTSARNLGFSSLVSMGNKADISGNDLLGYWHADPATDAILLYLESFGNPRKFGRLARTIGRSKPIIALKSGRSSVGARATASHTGALLSAADVTVDALFNQAGVIRTDTLDEMLDVAELLVHQPLPSGSRVAILTNAGGPAVMCADTCEARGLQVVELTAETRARLREVLPPEASVANPVDMIAAATAEQYARALRIIVDDPGVDAVISIFLPPLATQPEEVAEALVRVVDDLPPRKPVLGVFMSAHDLPPLTTRSGERLPGYHMPEPAAIALAHAVRYAQWRRRPLEEPPEFADVQPDAAGLLIASALRRGGGWLEPEEVRQLLALYGVPVVEQRVVRTPEEAAWAATELDGEVVVKAIAPGLLHKSDAGAVRLHLVGYEATLAAAHAMANAVERSVGVPVSGFLVQRMAAPGVEMLVGMVNDPQFGPTVACGAGGALVEIMNDVAIRLNPLTRSEAHAMLRDLRSFRLLQGYRGSRAGDVDALEEVLLRVSALAENHPRIAEMDCNPVIVSATGAVVVDARIRVADVPPAPPLGARR
jgi:acetate---CoA ligase (ADP-forming)